MNEDDDDPRSLHIAGLYFRSAAAALLSYVIHSKKVRQYILRFSRVPACAVVIVLRSRKCSYLVVRYNNTYISTYYISFDGGNG